jgi:protein-S-isoprenylcysteine O-methyltransferase Ste14
VIGITIVFTKKGIHGYYMAAEINDRPSIILPPPLIFFALLGAGFLLDYLIPFKLLRLPREARLICCAVLAGISFYFALGSIIVLLRNKTPFDPSKPTVKIVHEGPYRLSRNPMYLALLFLLTGFAVISGSIWLFLALPVLLIVLDIWAVRPEEAYLERNFSDRYLAYKAKVRRWLQHP